MSDINQEIADILRMANGTALSARERMALPAEIMDAMAGDAAQEAMMKSRVLEEMRKQTSSDYDPRFVNLDVMVEMEKGDVDSFLAKARKRIIKRGKGTRKACCTRIGGVLDQVVGPEGGDWADPKAAKDRGKADPIGEATVGEGVEVHHYDFPDLKSANEFHTKVMKHKNTRQAEGDRSGVLGAQAGPIISGKSYVPVTFGEGGVESHGDKVAALAKTHGGKRRQQNSDVDVDLLTYIAEEFSLSDHDADCDFAAMLAEAEAEAKVETTVGAPETGGRKFSAAFLANMGRGFAKKDAVAADAGLPGNASTGTPTPTSGAGRSIQVTHMTYEGNPMSESASKTANALAQFEECRYAAGAQKHTSSRGNMSPKHYHDAMNTRSGDDDNYDTIPTPLGSNKTAGAPKAASQKSKPRWEKGADPIGEDQVDSGVSSTALALSSFMEMMGPHVSTKHSSSADPMKNIKNPGPAGEEAVKTRPDNKQGYVKTGLLPAKSVKKTKGRNEKGGYLPGDAGEVENKDRRGGRKAKPF
jgi:hypothetical protein